MSREIFVNLPVRDLSKSMEFFTALGFTYNQQVTDDKAACMIIMAATRRLSTRPIQTSALGLLRSGADAAFVDMGSPLGNRVVASRLDCRVIRAS